MITEIFKSIQGEGTDIGLPYTFVRLTGCNLRCTYCDTSYAFKGGKKMNIDDVLDSVKELQCNNVLLTGGEPLMQRPTMLLAEQLKNEGFRVSIETHGEFDIRPFAGKFRIIMDVKTPSSGMNRGGFRKNIAHLSEGDEIKFVIASKSDYTFARNLIREKFFFNKTVLISPALPDERSPGEYEGVEPSWLAERILDDGLPVRFQLQLHKQIWPADSKGR